MHSTHAYLSAMPAMLSSTARRDATSRERSRRNPRSVRRAAVVGAKESDGKGRVGGREEGRKEGRMRERDRRVCNRVFARWRQHRRERRLLEVVDGPLSPSADDLSEPKDQAR